MSDEPVLIFKDKGTARMFERYINPKVLLGLILLLGIALRLYNLGAESYWIDEMSTVIEGQQSIQQLLASGRLDQPPAYYLPFHIWVQIFGTTEMSTRSFSALIGICSIALVYLIGRELFGDSVGLLSAFLAAISQFQIYYSQQARFYVYFEFSALLSFFFFILALRSKRNIHFLYYGIASIFMIYSHTYGMFVLAGQAIFFILGWKKYRDMFIKWVMCQALILFAIMPFFYPLIFGGNGVEEAVDANIGGLTLPSALDPMRSIYRFILSARDGRSWGVMLFNYAVAGIFFFTCIWIFVVWKGRSRMLNMAEGWFDGLQKIQDLKSKLLLLSCWLIFPIMLPFVLSMLISPMYLDRYTISAAPALYILLALGIFSIRKLVPIIASLGLLVIMITPSLAYYYQTDDSEQWKEVALYVNESSEPNDVIVFAPNQGIGIQQITFDWYYRGPLQGCGLSGDLVDSITISKALNLCVSGHDRFWVIIRDRSVESSSSFRFTSFFLSPARRGIQLISERHFVEISVYLFEFSK